MVAEDQNTEISRMQEQYNRTVERLEEDIKNLKEKVRGYEIKVNDLEIENDSLASRNKQLELFKDENAKKVDILNDRLEEKDNEIRRIR